MNKKEQVCSQSPLTKPLRHILALLVCCLFVTAGYGKIRLPQLISDRMVLQRDIELNIWGWADKGEKVTVRFKEKVYHTEPDENGKWIVTFPPQQAGGPFIMRINEITIRDILIGDVWLGSGQSNMETPITRLTDRYPEIEISNNHMIRYFKVPTQHSAVDGKDDIPLGGEWYSGTASDVLKWTALAFFYAQQAYEHTRVPQGMLIASLGGSAIESWISQEHLKPFPELLVDQEAWRTMNSSQLAGETAKWTSLDWDDTDWQVMELPGFWRDKGLNARGTVFFRKDFVLPDSMAGRYAKLYLGTLIDSDSVFINGHFVGSTSYMYPPRNYHVRGGILKGGKNNITVKLTANAGDGGFIPGKVYKISGDQLEIDLTGVWKYKVGSDLAVTEEYRQRLENIKTAGSSLYNGMIYPLRDYKIRGAIWYQGESNAGSPKNYQHLLTSLIENWRELFHCAEMPFLLVQLPNYSTEPTTPPIYSGWASIREAQLNVVMQVPYTALAVTYDVGEWNDLHPLNKKDVAHRLLLGARRLVFGEQLVSSGPLYSDMKIVNDKIIISFSEIGGGLQARNGKLKHFAVAGPDKKFVWADAVIKGNTIVVSSNEVKHPVAVRYAWSDNPVQANLMNKEGLLASPFRTDYW